MNSEAKGWLIATVILASAWALALAIVRYQTGPMDNPDDFSPFPPVSFFLSAILLVPATLSFFAVAAARMGYLAWQAIFRPTTKAPKTGTTRRES